MGFFFAFVSGTFPLLPAATALSQCYPRAERNSMASLAQINANQANAQLSTGPRTDAGKTRVSQNATRHGFTARHTVIRDDEQEEFAALQDSLTAELDPQGPLETITFQELLHAAWNLQRFSR